MPFRTSLLLLVFLAGPVASTRAAEPATQSELAAARALSEARKFPEARAAFEKILAHSPDEPEANCSLALFACDEGDWEKALRLAAKALASDPKNPRFQSVWGAANGIAALKAGVFSKMSYAKKCLAAYERAVELAPGSLQYRSALLNFYQQAPGLAGGSLPKAYLQAEEIRKIDAERGRQAFSQLLISEKKYEQAFRQFEDVLRDAPDDYLARYNFGRMTLLTGQRIDEGVAAFRRCLELTPPAGPNVPTHANVHWRLGNVWEKKSQPEEAQAAYREALKLDPEFAPAKNALAKLDAPKR